MMKTPGTASAAGGGAYYGGNHPHRRNSLSSDTSPDSRIFIPSITSQEILDENAASKGMQRRRGRNSRKVLMLALLGVVAIAGAVVAFVVTKSSGSTSASNASGSGQSSAKPSSSPGTGGTGSTTKAPSANFDKTSATGSSGNAKVKTDPTTETYALTTFAIGDWGATTYSKNGSCCSRRKGAFNPFDRHAEIGVSKLMAMEAKNNKPLVVMGHGDSFYWTGISGPNDQKYRFDLTFEERHGEDSMKDVPWVNVMGNHDYGGGSYICMDSQEQLVACNSVDEIVAGLKKKFDLQAKYKSPNNDRWIMTDHFFKYTVKNGDISIDIFNLDMNDAESHGADQICCQCYGYSEGDDKKCKEVTRGHKWCAGGDTGMYDACMKQFSQWGDDSRSQLLSELQTSKATWKIVNSHYSPYAHYGESNGKKWMEALESAKGLQLWIAGHTHGEKHDYGSFGMHFIENGAGGGIQSESASGIPPYASTVSNVWTAGGLDDGNTYGFFSIQASATWLKVRFMTFDDKWSLTKDDDGLKSGKIGGVVAKHCWYIPLDGGKGQKCDG